MLRDDVGLDEPLTTCPNHKNPARYSIVTCVPQEQESSSGALNLVASSSGWLPSGANAGL